MVLHMRIRTYTNTFCEAAAKQDITKSYLTSPKNLIIIYLLKLIYKYAENMSAVNEDHKRYP